MWLSQTQLLFFLTLKKNDPNIFFIKSRKRIKNIGIGLNALESPYMTSICPNSQ